MNFNIKHVKRGWRLRYDGNEMFFKNRRLAIKDADTGMQPGDRIVVRNSRNQIVAIQVRAQ